ncbi:hypothetical protein HN51_004747 [Arachis hypogaea]
MGLTGTLTPRIGVLKNLTALSLQGNAITRNIPKELENLTNLGRLDLENNRLTGQIPSSLGNLNKLQFLTLSQNNLNGTIPESLGNLRSLINIMLDSNYLSGEILEQLFKVTKYKCCVKEETIFFSATQHVYGESQASAAVSGREIHRLMLGRSRRRWRHRMPNAGRVGLFRL